MIPKKIHYVWFGRGEMNTTLKNCMASWKEKLPDYELKGWNEDNSPMDYPFMKQLLRHKKYGLISDYLRIYALYHEGGIYLDTDVEVIKPLDQLLGDKCFIGFQQEEPSGNWVNCSVMGAEKGHPYLKDCLNEFNRSQAKDLVPQVGAGISTKVLKEYGLKEYGKQEIENVTIYQHEYFYPYHFTETLNSNHIKETTHCIHHWQISWKGKKGIKAKLAGWWYKFRRALTVFFNIK